MIASLNEQMEQKDKELADLNLKIEGLNTQVATLNTNVTDLTAKIQHVSRPLKARPRACIQLIIQWVLQNSFVMKR